MAHKPFPFICECGYSTMNAGEALGHLREKHPEEEYVKPCPYCGTELVKRDTTALGGDESFDWCPDCERVIEDAEVDDVH